MVPAEATKVSAAIYTSTNWHTLPPHLRRHLVMIMRQIQRPLIMKGLNLDKWECNLENFTNVIIHEDPLLQCDKVWALLFR